MSEEACFQQVSSPNRPILVHIRTKIWHSRTSSCHRRSCDCGSPQATICRRQRSLKEEISSGAGGFCRSFWISSGSSNRFMSWVTRARESLSLAAILALVIPPSCSISLRQRQACWYGCMQTGSSWPRALDSETARDKMPLGNMMGSTMCGSAPQRENGIARIREWSQIVRVWFMPAEPISRLRVASNPASCFCISQPGDLSLQ